VEKGFGYIGGKIFWRAGDKPAERHKEPQQSKDSPPNLI
jgi:hypothetical protein